jgi:hypothetical protein
MQAEKARLIRAHQCYGRIDMRGFHGEERRIEMNDERPTLERIMQVASGGWALAILAAATRNSVFTHVEAGADTVEALAKKAGISPEAPEHCSTGSSVWDF